MNQNEHAQEGKSLRRSRIAFWVIAAIAAYFLLVEHGEHVVAYLPFALLLVCPLMHVFHRGHGHHGHAGHVPTEGAASGAPDAGSSLDEHRH